MRLSLLGCVAVASTLFLACTDASAPTSPTFAAEGTSAPTAALVDRFSFPFFDAFADGDLAAVLGVSPGQFAAFCAGDESVLDQIHFQQVTRPDGSLKLTVRSRPRLTIYAVGDAEEPCDLASSPPLATGKAQFNQTDNDVFVSLNRTNSFGSNLTGIASGDGGRFKVRSRVRITIQRNGEARVRSTRFGITELGG